MAFKAYAEKSKAKRGLAAYGDLAIAAADKLVHLAADEKSGEMKWGFITEQAEAARDGKDWTTHDTAEMDAKSGKMDEALSQATVMVAATPIEAGDAVVVTSQGMVAPLTEGEVEVAARNPGAGVFGNMASNVQETRTAPAPTNTNRRKNADTHYTIEKDRPTSNDITRPSAGGKCRAIWDALTEQHTKTGEVPTLKDARAALHEFDKTTVAVQYYRWRKYNGIVGRQTAAKTTEEKPAGPSLSEKISKVVKA